MKDNPQTKLQPLSDEHKEVCGCGHDHNHEEHTESHKESCSCGHDHSDEESCGCGHDHGHEERCGCGHDHNHEEHTESHKENCSCGHDHGHAHAQKSHTHAFSQETSKASAGKTVFILENLGCAHCASKMEEKIGRLPGVEEAVIIFATKQLRLSAENPQELLPEIQRICTSIESQVRVVPGKGTGQKAEEAQMPAMSHKEAKDGEKETAYTKKKPAEKRELLVILTGAGLFLAGIIMKYLGIPEMASLAVLLAAYVLLGGKVLLEAARNISHGQIFDENFLMSLATLGALAIREYPEAVGVMLFYRVGEYFEHRAVEKSRSQIMDAVDMRPEVVNLISGDTVQVIPAGEARVGDLLLIRPGDRIPLDGRIAKGDSRLDTSPITGEPVPVAVTAGDQVTSGCVNTSGQLEMRVEKPLEESMVTRILDSVENAAASKPRIDRFITRFSKVYTPVVVLLALGTAVIPSLIDGNWNYWIYTALTFLVMSCPCALVLSVPLAFFSGIGAGSRRGILFKGGASMESLSRLGAVVMDKTGTVTEGNFRLQKVVSEGAFGEEELLRMCAGCEQNSTHPIANSIVTAARERGIVPETPLSLEETAGQGIAARLPQGLVLCGNRKLMEANGVRLPDLSEGVFGAEVFLAVDGVFAGYMVISDTVKSDARPAIRRLKELGLPTVMLTGDSEDSAKTVAKETGIDEVYARLFPQEKLSALQKVREKYGPVMFVGDGINDAPVLAGADVGAAMGSGADAAIEAADAVFMTSSVESIPQAIHIARGSNRIALQNVVFALIIKAAVMLLGLAGFANMWMAVFADTGVAMLCVLNSIRILYKK